MKIAISIVAVLTVLPAVGAWAQGAVASNEVRLCEHENYQGKCVSFFLKPHMRHRLVRVLPAALDNEVSSIWVGGDLDIYVFEERDFKGASQLFFRGNPKISGPPMRPCFDYIDQYWTDQISSLIIVPRIGYAACQRPEPANHPLTAVPGVYLEASPPHKTGQKTTDCRQVYYPLSEDPAVEEVRIPNLGHYMDDRADEVAICGNLIVELYPEPHFKGTPVIFRENHPQSNDFRWDLADYGMKDKVSSVIVRPLGGKVEVGQAPPLLPPERGGEAAGEPHRAPPLVQPMEARPLEAAPAPGGQPDVSGLQVEGREITTEPAQTTFEHGINRAGGDYRNFDLPEPRPELCRDACIADAACRAYTYVKPGIQGASARCWLKSSEGTPRPDGCCVSGVKP